MVGSKLSVLKCMTQDLTLGSATLNPNHFFNLIVCVDCLTLQDLWDNGGYAANDCSHSKSRADIIDRFLFSSLYLTFPSLYYMIADR